MAKNNRTSRNNKAAAPKAAAKPVQNAKRAQSRVSAAKKATAAKTPSVKSTRQKAPKSTRAAAVKPKKRTEARLRDTVDVYVSTLNDWRKDCTNSLRKMIRQAAPKSSEKVQRSRTVYEHHGPFAWIKEHSRHVNLGFWRGVELADPRKLLSGAGNKMRHIKLSSLKDLGKKELQELVRLAAKLNEIKGSPTRRRKG